MEKPEHKVQVYCLDENNNMHSFLYYSIKNFLANENHVRNDNLKFHKAIVDGEELNNDGAELCEDYFRDLGDFKTYCRHRHGWDVSVKEVPISIIEKFLFDESEHKQKRVCNLIKNNKKIDEEYTNGGCGRCEYRPNQVGGYDFFNRKHIKIEWNDENADRCEGFITRSELKANIERLIREGRYVDGLEEKSGSNTDISITEEETGQLRFA